MTSNLMRTATLAVSKDKYYRGGKNLKSGNTGQHCKISDTDLGKKKRKRDACENEMAEAQLLDEAFELMVDVSPEPTEVFSTNSVDHKLAGLWLEKLTTMCACETQYERRLRNHYMSYFAVCLNKRELRGIFKEVPPEEITWVDFRDTIDSPSCSQDSRGMNRNDSTWQMANSFMQLTQQPSASGCCGGAGASGSGGASPSSGGGGGGCCKRSGGGVENSPWALHQVSSRSSRKSLQRTTHNLSYKSRPKLVPKNCTYGGQSSMSAGERSSSTLCAGSYDETMAQRQQRPMPQPVRNCRHAKHLDLDTRKDMTYLLDTIKSELRGDREKFSDDYLELEIRRYRDFYGRHRRNDPDFEKVLKAVNTPRERVYLLLNMQNDLVKLLQ